MNLRLFLIAYILIFLSACGGGGDAATSPPVTQVQTPTELRIVAGNGQSALPGSSLPIAPMIEVLDSANSPIANVSVSFTIELGGGTVKQAQIKTDSMGRASSGPWVLGLASGANILRARVGGLPPVDFTSLALSSSEQISISVLIPTPYQVINEEWSAQLSVQSNYEIATVKGTLSSVPFTLSQQDPFLQNWEGALPAQNLSRGESFIILTATDVNSNIANTIIPVVIDHPPRIVITEPKDSKAATPKIFIQITGEDDDNLNQPTIGVYVDGQMIASSIGKISNEVDLSVFTGKTIEMNFCVQDSAGQSKCSSRKIFVENNTSLSNMIEFDGLVMDVIGTRVLYLATQEQLPTLKIFDSSTGLTEIVESSQYLTDNVYAKLTPFGAIYERENGTFRIVNEWHNDLAPVYRTPG